MKSYKVETFTVPSGKFHWKLYEHISIPMEGRAELGKEPRLLEQCCTQDNAASPCEGFDLEEAAKKDGEPRRQELMAQE